MKDNMIITNSTNLGIILGVSQRRIEQLTKEGIVVKISHGKFNLPKSVQNYYKHKYEMKLKRSREGYKKEIIYKLLIINGAFEKKLQIIS